MAQRQPILMTPTDADLLRRLVKRRFKAGNGISISENNDSIEISYIGQGGRKAQSSQIYIRLTAGTGPYTGWHQIRRNAANDAWEKVDSGVDSDTTGIEAVAIGGESDLKVGEDDGVVGVGAVVYGPDSTPIIAFTPWYDDSNDPEDLTPSNNDSTSAETTEWDINDQTAGKSGFKFRVFRTVYDNTGGSEKFLRYYMDITVNGHGRIVAKSQETEETLVAMGTDCSA